MTRRLVAKGRSTSNRSSSSLLAQRSRRKSKTSSIRVKATTCQHAAKNGKHHPKVVSYNIDINGSEYRLHCTAWFESLVDQSPSRVDNACSLNPEGGVHAVLETHTRICRNAAALV